jgi:hypothetical protein
MVMLVVEGVWIWQNSQFGMSDSVESTPHFSGITTILSMWDVNKWQVWRVPLDVEFWNMATI